VVGKYIVDLLAEHIVLVELKDAGLAEMLKTMFPSVLPHFERAIEETESTTNDSV
jgi:hypothetical protein